MKIICKECIHAKVCETRKTFLSNKFTEEELNRAQESLHCANYQNNRNVLIIRRNENTAPPSPCDACKSTKNKNACMCRGWEIWFGEQWREIRRMFGYTVPDEDEIDKEGERI